MDIFFWDIDGTLIRTDKAGLYAFEQSVRELWDSPVDFRQIHSAGMTDYSIARQIIEKIADRPASHQEVKQLTGRYEALLQEHLAQRLRSVSGALPQFQETISHFGLLTVSFWKML